MRRLAQPQRGIKSLQIGGCGPDVGQWVRLVAAGERCPDRVLVTGGGRDHTAQPCKRRPGHRITRTSKRRASQAPRGVSVAFEGRC